MARRTFTREFKVHAYPQGYIEGFDELRTKLAGFFSILSPQGYDRHAIPALCPIARSGACDIGGIFQIVPQ